MREEWRAVIGYEGLYEVSSLGAIRSCDRKVHYRNGRTHIHRGRSMYLDKLNTGYLRVRLSREGSHRRPLVQYLVAAAFLGERPPGMQLLHFNDIKTDNRVSNLRWGTSFDNAADKDRNGRASKGERRPNSKLTDFKVRCALALLNSGATNTVVARVLGVSHALVYGINIGKRWKHIPRETYP